MNNEVNLIWQELYTDVSTPVIFWQICIIFMSLGSAWLMNAVMLKALIKNSTAVNQYHVSELGLGGLKRMLFPLTSLLLVFIGQHILKHWQHTGLLRLTITLLIAMAVIRLSIYALRYIFAPSGWVKGLEHFIGWSIWVILALHLSGLLPEIIHFLNETSFNVGKNELTLMLLIQALFTIFITLFGALWCSRLLENKLMQASRMNMNLRVVLSKLVRIILTLIAILFSLSAVGLDVTLLSVFGGALGVGLGFGLQKIASNYVSGFIILMDDSIHIGDILTVDTHNGVVSELRSRYLLLRKENGTKVIIPNESLIITAVTNHSHANRQMQQQLPILISYEANLDEAIKLAEVAATNQAGVLKVPPPKVAVKGFADKGIELMAVIWVEDGAEQSLASVKSNIYLAIWQTYSNAGIAFAVR